MAVGLPISRAVIDSRIGNLALQARRFSEGVTQLVAGVGSLTDQQIIDISATGGQTPYTLAEVAVLRAAAAPMVTAKNALTTAPAITALNAVTGID